MKKLLALVLLLQIAYFLTDSGRNCLSGSPRADSLNVRIVGHYDTAGTAWDVTVLAPDTLVCVADGTEGMRVISIVDPEHPEEIGFTSTPGNARGVTVFGDYVFVSDYNAGLTVIDVRDPGNPIVCGTFDTPGFTEGVIIMWPYLLLADNLGGLRVLDISDPCNPVEVGHYDTAGFASGLAISPDSAYLYLADWSEGLRVFSIYFPESPNETSHCDTDSIAYDVDVEGTYAYVADGGGGLVVFDVSDPEDCRRAGFYHTPGTAMDIEVKGGLVFMADGLWGLEVLAVSDPINPFIQGYYDLPGEARGISVHGSYQYIAAGYDGLFITEYYGPTSIQGDGEKGAVVPKRVALSQNYPNPFNPATTITFHLSGGISGKRPVNLCIYDIRGRLIRKLVDSPMEPGFHTVIWDGEDDRGKQVATGVYIYTLTSGSDRLTRKMVLLK